MEWPEFFGTEVFRTAGSSSDQYVIRATPGRELGIPRIANYMSTRRHLNRPGGRWTVKVRQLSHDPAGVPVMVRDVYGRRAAVQAAEEIASSIARGDLPWNRHGTGEGPARETATD